MTTSHSSHSTRHSTSSTSWMHERAAPPSSVASELGADGVRLTSFASHRARTMANTVSAQADERRSSRPSRPRPAAVSHDSPARARLGVRGSMCVAASALAPTPAANPQTSSAIAAAGTELNSSEMTPSSNSSRRHGGSRAAPLSVADEGATLGTSVTQMKMGAYAQHGGVVRKSLPQATPVTSKGVTHVMIMRQSIARTTSTHTYMPDELEGGVALPEVRWRPRLHHRDPHHNCHRCHCCHCHRLCRCHHHCHRHRMDRRKWQWHRRPTFGRRAPSQRPVQLQGRQPECTGVHTGYTLAAQAITPRVVPQVSQHTRCRT